jgi:transposase
MGRKIPGRAKKGALLEEDVELFFMDETTIGLRFPLRACWMRRGQQKRIKAFTSPKRSLHLIGAHRWRTDQIFTQEVERKNSQTFIQFLEYLLVECFPTKLIVLVMDNVSYHKSKMTLAALSSFEPRVKVFWLPKYCPNLNPIERFWRHLKDLAGANKLDTSLDNLSARVNSILDCQNSLDHHLRMSFLKNIV